MDYEPRPIDTSDEVLDPGLVELTERLSENTHEVWSVGRIKGGWRFGPTRDDSRKEHPCLIPYGDLPDSEKEFDRGTAMETLKAIQKLGYRIEPPKAAEVPTIEEHPAAPRLLDFLANPDLKRDDLISLWRTPKEDRRSWSYDPQNYSRFAERMLRTGEPLLAYDLTVEGLTKFPNHVRLRQLQGLALARSGDTEKARDVLARLQQEGQADEETLGLLARTYKDLGIKTEAHDPSRSRAYLERSLEIYADANRRSGGIWTGINAATLALLLEDEAQARTLAAEVLEQSRLEFDKAGSSDTYWTMATMGEASLILNDLDQAERWYAMVGAIAQRDRRFGDLSSTRRQARLLLKRRPEGQGLVDRCFRTPRVAVFVGHMIDRPGRASPRFPMELESTVRDAIRASLERSGARIGYASASSGSDLLFLETLLELGGEAHVVLPYDRESFVKQSVEVVEGTGWLERFQSVLDRAELITASPQKLEIGGISYDFANRMMQGLATLRAEQLDGELVPMAVWDGLPGDGPGGTADTVRRWQNQGDRVEVIDLAAIASSRGISSKPALVAPSEPATGGEVVVDKPSEDLGTQIVAILFGDVVGFSKLTEEQIPRFVRHFLGLVAEQLALLPSASVKKNTWGDGLYCVFEDLRDAGRFAINLRDRVISTRWEEKGLPGGLNMRIALHAGPVYLCTDPVTERLNCIGTHVSHAARIEPITPPGQVFASQAFAALTAAEKIREFRCHYVGQTPLAKGYGVYPTYHVHPFYGN